MKLIALVALTLACLSCQTIPQDAEGKGSGKSSVKSHEIIVDIDPFYKEGIHPKVRLQGHEAAEVRAIIKSAPEVDLEPIPPGRTISPAPGLSVIEDGDDAYHIMPDCEIVGRRISLEGRMRLFRILSKHTSHFEEPKA
jgi:hypothetical protein